MHLYNNLHVDHCSIQYMYHPNLSLCMLTLKSGPNRYMYMYMYTHDPHRYMYMHMYSSTLALFPKDKDVPR